jgi:hypothetical protein
VSPVKRLFRGSALLVALACGSACDEGAAPPKEAQAPDAQVTPERYPLAKLKDPATCERCHPKHYREWEASMHAYASIDPVFIAMNKRGQRETGGKLGDFCVNCHAPIAVREKLISPGGLDVESAPKWAQGVTCYFCHNAIGLENPEQHFNGNLKLANDRTMRGSFEALDPGVHGVAKSSFHDDLSKDSSLLCGSCHDVENGDGVRIERTFDEYKKSMFSFEEPANPDAGTSPETCQGCHMPVTQDRDFIAVNPDLNSTLRTPRRSHHEHRWPAVDIALTDDFPGQAEHRALTECELHVSVSISSVEVDPLGAITVRLETFAGHAQPSGTAQDRRMWLEFIAYDADGKVMFESGTIADGEVEQERNDARPNRRQLLMFRDHLLDAAGNEVHMFWQAQQPSKSELLLPPRWSGDVHSREVKFQTPGFRRPARAVMRLRMRPMGMDVLQSLVDSGDLDPKFLAKVPTFTINNSYVEWRAADPPGMLREPQDKKDRSDECDKLRRREAPP